MSIRDRQLAGPLALESRTWSEAGWAAKVARQRPCEASQCSPPGTEPQLARVSNGPRSDLPYTVGGDVAAATIRAVKDGGTVAAPGFPEGAGADGA